MLHRNSLRAAAAATLRPTLLWAHCEEETWAKGFWAGNLRVCHADKCNARMQPARPDPRCPNTQKEQIRKGEKKRRRNPALPQRCPKWVPVPGAGAPISRCRMCVSRKLPAGPHRPTGMPEVTTPPLHTYYVLCSCRGRPDDQILPAAAQHEGLLGTRRE